MISIMVCNREEAERALYHDDSAVISIYTPGDTPAVIPQVDKHVLSLCFSDITDTKLAARIDALPEGECREMYERMKLFTMEQAKEILDFVDKMIAKNVTHFTIHCDAGISRSPGVAVALNQIYNDDKDIPYRYQLFNRFVYTKLLDAKYGLQHHMVEDSPAKENPKIKFTEGV